MEEMSEEERKNFEIDASNINWKDYLTRIHISGVKKHVFEGKKLPIQELINIKYVVLLDTKFVVSFYYIKGNKWNYVK